MFLLTKKKLIDELAAELVCLQVEADYWHYVSPANNEESKEENLNMSSRALNLVLEVKRIAQRFRIEKEVYNRAYEVYDFRNSGKKDFVPNIELIKALYSACV